MRRVSSPSTRHRFEGIHNGGKARYRQWATKCLESLRNDLAVSNYNLRVLLLFFEDLTAKTRLQNLELMESLNGVL